MRTNMMSRAAMVLVLVLLGSTVVAAPAAIFNDTTFDFGYVPQNAKISHVFTIMSTGDDTLKIVRVIPGCGCTKVPLEKSEVGPGDQTWVEVIFSTGQYKGRVTKHPRVLTNESNAQHMLQFVSTVVPRIDSTYPIIVRPAILDLDGTNGMPAGTMIAEIRNVSDKPLTMKLVDCPEGLLKVTLPESIPAGGLAKVKVELSGEGGSEGFQKSFTIQCDDAQASRFTLPVTSGTDKPSDHAAAPASGH